jgi:hypothetical protein
MKTKVLVVGVISMIVGLSAPKSIAMMSSDPVCRDLATRFNWLPGVYGSAGVSSSNLTILQRSGSRVVFWDRVTNRKVTATRKGVVANVSLTSKQYEALDRSFNGKLVIFTDVESWKNSAGEWLGEFRHCDSGNKPKSVNLNGEEGA